MRCNVGVLAVRGMRKDSARGVSWRYGVGLLYLGCVCVAGSPPVAAPLKRLGRQMEIEARGGSWRSPTTSVMPRPDSSVVERGPEKAGVGGSIPSLATIYKSTTYKFYAEASDLREAF